jgi:hypothetical protein
MRPIGRRSSTRPLPAVSDRGRRSAPAALLSALLVLLMAAPAPGLDMLTLWRQPELPLRLAAGDWAHYRTQVMVGGRRESGATRIACLGRDGEGEDAPWILELVPLAEPEPDVLVPVAADGVRLTVDPAITGRGGDLLDHVIEARRWTGAGWETFDRADLRADPLLASSLEQGFLAQDVRRDPPTTRVVQGREMLCEQFVLTSADTLAADLPAGRMIQVTTREIAAAVARDVPFLGLAYAAERSRSESRLDPPSRRFKAPPPQVRVEIMELVAFGTGARPVLGAPD